MKKKNNKITSEQNLYEVHQLHSEKHHRGKVLA